MLVVVCWCCEEFVPNEYSEYEFAYNKYIDGICRLKNKPCNAQDDVCEDFILRSGLFTKRVIPLHCKNYNKSK